MAGGLVRQAPGRSDIVRVLAPNPGPMTLDGTNTYLVGRDPCFVIDPGPDLTGHVQRVCEEAERRGGLGGVLLTHSHADHADALPALAAPRVAAADAGLEQVPTPGHAPDHVCFVLDDVVFAGDLVLGTGSSYVPPDGGSLAAYLESLERLLELESELLCPGHGPWVTDPQAKLREYVEHRMMRERLLVEALDEGVRSHAELLARAWHDVPFEMRPAAAVVMEAHLEKLAAEGRLPDGLER